MNQIFQSECYRKYYFFKIDKILKTKTAKGEKLSLISWLGWPKDVYSWIPTDNIESYADTI